MYDYNNDKETKIPRDRNIIKSASSSLCYYSRRRYPHHAERDTVTEEKRRKIAFFFSPIDKRAIEEFRRLTNNDERRLSSISHARDVYKIINIYIHVGYTACGRFFFTVFNFARVYIVYTPYNIYLPPCYVYTLQRVKDGRTTTDRRIYTTWR